MIRKVVPRYPPVRADAVVECLVSLAISPEGVATVESIGCEEPFASATSTALAQWRWEKRDSVALTTVKVVFRPGAGTFAAMSDEQYRAILGAHEPAEPERAEGEPCRLEVALLPDGSVSGLRSNALPECLLVPSDGGPTGKAWKGVDATATCALRFEADGPGSTGVTPIDCPAHLVKPTVRLARRWGYNVLDGKPTPYEVRFTWAP